MTQKIFKVFNNFQSDITSLNDIISQSFQGEDFIQKKKEQQEETLMNLDKLLEMNPKKLETTVFKMKKPNFDSEMGS